MTDHAPKPGVGDMLLKGGIGVLCVAVAIIALVTFINNGGRNPIPGQADQTPPPNNGGYSQLAGGSSGRQNGGHSVSVVTHETFQKFAAPEPTGKPCPDGMQNGSLTRQGNVGYGCHKVAPR